MGKKSERWEKINRELYEVIELNEMSATEVITYFEKIKFEVAFAILFDSRLEEM